MEETAEEDALVEESVCCSFSARIFFNEIGVPVWDIFPKCLSFKSSLLHKSICVFDKVDLDMPEVRGHVSCHCL